MDGPPLMLLEKCRDKLLLGNCWLVVLNWQCLETMWNPGLWISVQHGGKCDKGDFS